MLFWRILEPLVLGFLVGLVPGPVVTAVFTETIRRGGAGARRLVVTGAGAELLRAVICVLALSFVNPASVIFAALRLFGAFVLFGLGWELWRVEEIPEEEPLFSSRRLFTRAFLHATAWAFWLTVGVALSTALGQEVPLGKSFFVVAFVAAWLSSTLLLALLFTRHRPYFQSNRKLHLLYRAVATGFLLFALELATESARALLN